MHADTINSKQPYKTLLVSNDDSALAVLQEMLDKYDIKGYGPEEFALFEISVPEVGQVSPVFWLSRLPGIIRFINLINMIYHVNVIINYNYLLLVYNPSSLHSQKRGY